MALLAGRGRAQARVAHPPSRRLGPLALSPLPVDKCFTSILSLARHRIWSHRRRRPPSAATTCSRVLPACLSGCSSSRSPCPICCNNHHLAALRVRRHESPGRFRKGLAAKRRAVGPCPPTGAIRLGAPAHLVVTFATLVHDVSSRRSQPRYKIKSAGGQT